MIQTLLQYEQFIPEGVHDIHLAVSYCMTTACACKHSSVHSFLPPQDMVPKYMADKSFGKSLYSADFDGEKVCL